jgi:hypothetical protein
LAKNIFKHNVCNPPATIAQPINAAILEVFTP